MLARFELFNDQTFYQNNRQDLNQSLLLFLSWKSHCRILGFLHRSNRLIRGSRVNFRVYKAVKMPRIGGHSFCVTWEVNVEKISKIK
jgi:hypothetical protein